MEMHGNYMFLSDRLFFGLHNNPGALPAFTRLNARIRADLRSNGIRATVWRVVMELANIVESGDGVS